MAKVCIICQKEISGSASKVKNDGVIEFIRRIKNALKVAQNNELYVCETDMKPYLDRRKRFEKDVVMYGILAIAVVVLLVGLPLLGGKFELGVLIYSILLGALVFVLGALIKYVPAVESGTPEEVPKAIKKKKVK
jgi:hypothetical protein